jgi:hypothetical protein
MATNPEAGFIPNEQEGIVFGQMQILIEGNLYRYDGKKLFGVVCPQMIVTHVSPYSDEQSVNTNILLPGKLAFKTQIADNGYFTAKLPVGRYYVSEFMFYLPNYVSFPPAYLQFPKGYKTYMYSAGLEPSDPKIVIFDVFPNKATYIGTFIHRVDTGDDKKTSLNVRIKNEYDACKSVFLAAHPVSEESIVSEPATSIPYKKM